MGGTVIIVSGLVLFASDLGHFETGADQDQDPSLTIIEILYISYSRSRNDTP